MVWCMSAGPDLGDDEFDSFFDDRRIFATSRTREASSRRLQLPARRAEPSDLAIGVVLAGLSAAALVIMRSTSPAIQHEIAGSRWFGPAQLGAIAAVTLASVLRPYGGRVMQWTVLVVAPWMAMILIEGWVLFDPYRSAWLGAMSLVPLAACAAACWIAGSVAAHWRQRRPRA